MLTGTSRSCGLLLALHHCWHNNDFHRNWFDKYPHVNLKYREVGRISDHCRRRPWPHAPDGKFILPAHPASHPLTNQAHSRDTKQSRTARHSSRDVPVDVLSKYGSSIIPLVRTNHILNHINPRASHICSWDKRASCHCSRCIQIPRCCSEGTSPRRPARIRSCNRSGVLSCCWIRGSGLCCMLGHGLEEC